ncbi:uncharacterized protein LOC113163467 isoform X2 [Anabas testudineus]|uniref:uncharacterized protein LOC113163467 isoform X2 n=1 Tax=Anabas testudineus TaxID=64144 RepID=UPI000E4576A6|nr:uncharacterized protein LOC113163467 isoform X2 [Anabas testudineus]
MSVLCFLLMLIISLKDVSLTSVVQTHQTVMAAVGEEAHFSCQLMESKDVLQVTWQKVLPEGEKNMATYNKYFGQRVNSDFRDKVKFKDVGLQKNSIVIRNVMEQDAGCYRCLFNTYPDGALSARTCLQLYVRDLQPQTLDDPSLGILPLQELRESLRESNSTEDSAVSADDFTMVIVVVPLVLTVLGFLAVVYYIWYKQKSKTRDPEEIRTPLKAAKDPQEIVTPLIKMMSDQVKQRTSTKKSPNCPKPVPSEAKCPRKLF